MGSPEVRFNTTFVYFYIIIMGQLYIPILALPITNNTLLEPHSSQPLLSRNATTNNSTSTASDQLLSTVIPPIILGVFGGIFTVGCFVVSVKQYRRSNTSHLEELMMRTCTTFSGERSDQADCSLQYWHNATRPQHVLHLQHQPLKANSVEMNYGRKQPHQPMYLHHRH
jgi:hypothetical protein